MQFPFNILLVLSYNLNISYRRISGYFFFLSVLLLSAQSSNAKLYAPVNILLFSEVQTQNTEQLPLNVFIFLSQSSHANYVRL